MKTFYSSLIILVLCISASGHVWEPFGPEGVNAYKIHIFENDYGAALFTDSGFYLNEDIIGTNWIYIDFPASGAVSYNADTILLVLNEGTYSDGIYYLDVNTQEIDVLEYCVKPNYIVKVPNETHYFVGHEYGMLESIGGLNWTEVSYLNDCRCIDMAITENQYAVACDMIDNNVFISIDEGLSWDQIVDENKYTGLGSMNYYSSESYITGICQSTKSEMEFPGLCKYTEDGWEVLYHSTDISALGCDNSQSPVIGWEQGVEPDVGIGRYHSSSPYEIEYFNEGLPDLNILDIGNTNPSIVGSIWIFCVTESGAYLCKGIGLSSEDLNDDETSIVLFPNPASTKITIQLPGETNVTASASFYDVTGNIVMLKAISTPSCQVDISSFSAGVYYVQIVDAHDRVIGSQKIVKQ